MNAARHKPIFYLLAFVFFFLINPLFGTLVIAIFSPFFTRVEKNIASWVIVSVCIVFFATAQPFSDLAEYLNIYKDINDINIFSYTRFGMGIEFLILIIMKVSFFLSGGSEFFFLLVIYSIIFILLYKVCKEIDGDFYLLIFFIVFYSYGFIQANSMFLRQMLAMLFLLLMIFSNGIPRFTYGLLSVFSHTSMIIGIVSYCIVRLRKYNLLLLISVFLFSILTFFVYSSGLSEYLIDKVISVQSKSATLNTVQVLIYNFPVFIVFSLFLFHRKKINKSHASFFFIFFGFLNFAIFWFGISIPTVSNRLGLFICAFSGLLLYPLISGRVTYMFKYKILICMLLINFFPATYTLYNIELRGSDLNFLDFKPLTSDFLDISKLLLERISGDMPYLNQGNE